MSSPPPAAPLCLSAQKTAERLTHRCRKLTKQYNVCGKAACRCKTSPPKKHGPYYQVSYTRKGRSGSKFVRGEQITRVRQQLKNYTKLRTLVDRWIEAGAELSNLRLEEEKS